MKYAAPRILTTNSATAVIQEGTDPMNKAGSTVDNAFQQPSNNPGYEADE